MSERNVAAREYGSKLFISIADHGDIVHVEKLGCDPRVRTTSTDFQRLLADWHNCGGSVAYSKSCTALAWVVLVAGVCSAGAGPAGIRTLPGLPPYRVSPEVPGRPAGARSSHPPPRAPSGVQSSRKLQAATKCAGNIDPAQNVVCMGGSVAVDNGEAVFGSDQDTCCMCSPGTTAAYGDENLAFRFRPDSITTADDGSLLWPAVEPPELAFTMTRYDDPPQFHDATEAATYYTIGNASEPSRDLPSGFLPGLMWEYGEHASYDQGSGRHRCTCALRESTA